MQNASKPSPEEQYLLRPPEYFALQEYGGSTDARKDADEAQPLPYSARTASSELGSHTRTIGIFDGIALVVCAQVGTGIYWAPRSILSATGSETAALLCWLVAGILAWTGADSIAALGTIVPLNGGIMEYVRFCLGDTFAFVTSWCLILLIQPSTCAILSIICSRQVLSIFGIWFEFSSWSLRLLACLTATIFTAINCTGIKGSKRAARLFFLVKLLGLFSIIGIGLGLRLRLGHVVPWTSPDEESALADPDPPGKRTWLGDQMHKDARAVFTAYWVYSGWSSLSYLGGEIHEPRRSMPRIMNVSLAMVVGLYVLANVGFIAALGTEHLQHTWSAAADLGTAAFGIAGKKYFQTIVCLSCMGVLHVKTLAAGRLIQAAGDREYLPNFLTTLLYRLDGLGRPAHHKDRETPRGAMLLNLFLTCLSMFSGSLWTIMGISGFLEKLSLLAMVIGLLRLLYGPRTTRQDHLEGAYRGFVLSPVIFCMAAAYPFARGLDEHPVRGLVTLVFLICAGVAYKTRAVWSKNRLGSSNSNDY